MAGYLLATLLFAFFQAPGSSFYKFNVTRIMNLFYSPSPFSSNRTEKDLLHCLSCAGNEKVPYFMGLRYVKA